MNRGWSEDRLGFQNEGLFCTGAASVTVAAASQWPRQQEKGRARLPRACVRTAARNSPAAPQMEAPTRFYIPSSEQNFLATWEMRTPLHFSKS